MKIFTQKSIAIRQFIRSENMIFAIPLHFQFKLEIRIAGIGMRNRSHCICSAVDMSFPRSGFPSA